jgi:hypothetical protein
MSTSNLISREEAKALIAQCNERMREGAEILGDAARCASIQDNGPEATDAEKAWLADCIFRYIGKRFSDDSPATLDDATAMAEAMRASVEAVMHDVASIFQQLAKVAAQVGRDTGPFTTASQLLQMNLAGLLRPDPARLTPSQLFTATSYTYSSEIWESRLRGAGHPHDALLQLEVALDAQVAEASLSERQMLILQAMMDMKAFCSDSRQTTDAIARRTEGADIDPARLKDAIADLREKKLIETKGGRGGGCWLTAAGKARAETLQNL